MSSVEFESDVNNRRADCGQLDLEDAEGSLKEQREKCSKIKRHAEFISWPDFKADPRKFSTSLKGKRVTNFVLAKGALTVRLCVGYVSKNRVKTDKLFAQRGTFSPHTGSGLVVFRTESTIDRCLHGENCLKPHWRIYVVTATHVVSGHKEAENVTIDLDYDFERNEPGRIIKKFYGVRLSERSFFRDCCVLDCVTCDPDLKNTLDSRLSEIARLHKILPKLSSDVAVIISHPHGLEKKISFGSCRQVSKTKKWILSLTTYEYDTATCKGSSGSPVIILQDLWAQSGSRVLITNLPTHIGSSDENSFCGGSYDTTLNPNWRRRSIYKDATPPGHNFRKLRLQASSFLDQFSECKNKSEHSNLIPFSAFTMEDLPEAVRDKDTRKLIETVAKLTCKVTVRNTALDRPKYYPGTTKLYPTHRGRRHSEMRTGSGVVYFSSGIFRNESSRCCCHDCQEVNDPVVGFTVVYVRTAKHVVFNTIEATYAKFSFKNIPGDKLIELAGISVVDSDIESDISIVECVTHDLNAAELFEGIQKEMMRLDKLIRSRSTDRKRSKLAVVVSHPHGWGKVVSVGESVSKAVTNQTVDDMLVWYSHTSMTCPGSSGGPVVLMDQKEPKVLERFLMPHVHSCGEGVQKGFSGQGVSGFVKLT